MTMYPLEAGGAEAAFAAGDGQPQAHNPMPLVAVESSEQPEVSGQVSVT